MNSGLGRSAGNVLNTFSTGARYCRRVSTVTSWKREICMAHCQPTSGSEPLYGSHAKAERSTRFRRDMFLTVCEPLHDVASVEGLHLDVGFYFKFTFKPGNSRNSLGNLCKSWSAEHLLGPNITFFQNFINVPRLAFCKMDFCRDLFGRWMFPRFPPFKPFKLDAL